MRWLMLLFRQAKVTEIVERRHVRDCFWQVEHRIGRLERTLSTGELFMVLRGLARVEDILVSTYGLTIGVEEAARLRLFDARVLTNDQSILQKEVLQFNWAGMPADVMILMRMCALSISSPVVLAH